MEPVHKIQNPTTKRWIRRDGRVHRALQRQGVLPSEPPRHAQAPAATVRGTQVHPSMELPQAPPTMGQEVLPQFPPPRTRSGSPYRQETRVPRQATPSAAQDPVETESDLPRCMVPFPNKDKGFHESWYRRRDLLDIPHPFRMVLLSKPNGGKTTLILNIILRVSRTTHPFERIVIVHCDPTATREYSDVEHDSLDRIPGADAFEPQQKTLVILEDLNYLDMSSEQRGKLERLFGYVSTHKNVSVILTAQDPFRLLPTVRRCANVFVMWNNHDGDMIQRLARKCGMTSKKLLDLFHEHCEEPHDCIWLDFTTGSPAPIRKNGFQPLHV